MALTQIQIIQSLGEAMHWFERELQWGTPPTELRHLSGRIGELYAALITNGQMASNVNQKGYDVVSEKGERISVKTTAMMTSSGHISFNQNTLKKVDRVMIFRINTEEMQIETLFNDTKEESYKLMTKPKNTKASISLSKLLKAPPTNIDIPVIKKATYKTYKILELENGTILIEINGELVSPVKPELRKIAYDLNVSLLNSNGNDLNTRQLGSILIRTINSK